MSIFIRLTGPSGKSFVFEADKGMCIPIASGMRVELLGITREMVKVEPLGDRLYFSIFLAGGFELGDIHAAYASAEPPELVFGAEESPGHAVATLDDFERFLAERGPGASRDASGFQILDHVSAPAASNAEPVIRPDIDWPRMAAAG